MPDERADGLPPPLAIAAQIQARNNEYNLDLTGRVTHLDEEALLTTFPVEIPQGTVLFSIIDLRTINATVRGLVRVRWQDEAGDLGGFRTLADFVDLNADERRKISRILGKVPDYAGAAAGDEAAAQSVGYMPMSTMPARQPKRPSVRWLPNMSVSGTIWGMLGLVFYSIVVLGVVALFPQGRAWELAVFQRSVHELNHLFPGFRHLFGLV
ncbi:MAG: hypothetical protein JO219_06875 [Candidatus Eremiobacteraeota bacterium]|nr:hypothetical protein [Candidatus Eremiobacteraeota bacterium]